MAATVWVKPLNDTWQPVGAGSDRGVWHEGLTCVSDQWGPKSLTFTLRRQRRARFPDLLTHTPVVVEEGGVKVWRGRVKTTPETNGRDRIVNVECQGGQYRLDDDKLERVLVHTKIGDWKDARSYLVADLTKAVAAGQMSTDGSITLTFPKDTALPAGQPFVGAILDLGPASTAKAVTIDWTSSNNQSRLSTLARGIDTPEPFAGAGETPINFAMNSGAFGFTTGTFTTPRRYVAIELIENTGAALTLTADVWLKVSGVTAWADSAYHSSGVSVLSAKTIIVDALTRAVTGLHPDWSGIGDPTLAFPDFAPDAPRTARELVAAANGPHGWQFKINENLQPVYRARPTVPLIDLGAWLGNEGDTGSSNTDEGVVTKVIVRGKDAADQPVRSTRTQSGTIVDRQGDAATITLDASYTLTSTFANKLGDAYLAAHQVAPFKGQNTITAEGARRSNSGGTIRPAHLLLLTGELARRTDLVDPDTGGLGRTAVIDQVTYRDDDGIAEVDLDNTRRDFEALQERLGLLIPT